MKSIFLIFAAAVFSSSCLLAAEPLNYSLWPRRPENVSRALELQKRGGDEQELLRLVTPHLRDEGIGGREARALAGRINAARYLSSRRPNLSSYTVRGGDSFFRIAERLKCPVDVLMYMNGTMEPSSLKAGQKLIVPQLNLTLEIHSDTREMLVWDGETLVASYRILKESLPPGVPNKTQVWAREAFIDGRSVVRNSADFASAGKELVLSAGRLRITPRPIPAPDRNGWQISAADATELALLIVPGNDVFVMRDGQASPARDAGNETPEGSERTVSVTN